VAVDGLAFVIQGEFEVGGTVLRAEDSYVGREILKPRDQASMAIVANIKKRV
jgi:hypothetical protein